MADNNNIVFNFIANVQGALKAFTGINQGLELIEKTIRYVKEAYEALVEPTMEYARAVRETSQALGLTTLETSKLIQVADDFNISQDALISSLEMAVKRGYQPSIENLAQLADKLKSMPSPIQRAELLTEMFGRQWTALNPMLSEGGDAIRGAADEAENMGLVMSGEAVQAARDLEKAIDNLEDTATGLKLQLTTATIPTIVTFVDKVNALTFSFTEAGAAMEKELIARAKGLEDAINPLVDESFPKLKDASQLAAEEEDRLARAAEEASAALEEQDEAAQLLAISLSGKYQAAMDKLIMAELELSALKPWQESEILKANAAIEDQKKAVDKVIASMLYQIFIEGLNKEAALELARALGLVAEEDYQIAKAMQDAKKAADEKNLTDQQQLDLAVLIKENWEALRDKRITITELILRVIRTTSAGFGQPTTAPDYRGVLFDDRGQPINPPKYASGGSFEVMGKKGIDNQLVSFMATPGETVSVTPAGQAQSADARGPAIQVGQVIMYDKASEAAMTTFLRGLL